MKKYVNKAETLNWFRRLVTGDPPLVHRVVVSSEGGIQKRIDENRELLELLCDQVPELLERQPWVVGWLRSQDRFLCEIASAVPNPHGGVMNAGEVRPWPEVSAASVTFRDAVKPY